MAVHRVPVWRDYHLGGRIQLFSCTLLTPQFIPRRGAPGSCSGCAGTSALVNSWFGLWTANRSPFACVGRGGIRRPCPIRASDRSGRSINRDGGTLTSILTWTGLMADQEEPLPKSVTSIALGRNIGLPSSQVESGCHQFVQIFNNFHIHMNIERRHRLCLWSKFGLLGVIRRAAADL
jgi:hypothetical protein